MATTSPGAAAKFSNQSFCPATTTPISNSSFKMVFLQDWWLVKADLDFHGKRLAVGGLAFRERQALRGFSSAPIVKRIDTFTLETSDGITIAIKGLINWSRTHQNGFSMEVCNHFLIGFPYYWEDYTAQYFGTCDVGVPTSIFNFNEKIRNTYNKRDSDLQHHLHELPVAKTFDHLMSSSGISDNCVLTKGVFNDIVQKLSICDSANPGVSIQSYLNRSSASMAGPCFAEETPSRSKKAKNENKHDNGKDFVDPENGKTVEGTRVPCTEEQNNLSCEGSNEPKSKVLEGKDMMKSCDTTVDAAENSILPENTEACLVEEELWIPNSISDEDEDGGTKSILKFPRRKGRSNSRVEKQRHRHSPERFDSLKCDRKDTKKTVSGSNNAKLNIMSHVGEKSCCGNGSSLGSDGLQGTREETSSKPTKFPKREQTNDIRVRRDLRNSQ
ncbi:hypothetical protein NE237_012650 [Protea cynaroides]|uniref:SANTA domain-containing protein n=1 Tax=Protea cynaroides TaxID=273540 RepID=A0A9Q0GX85_9MAGN|nr:hypothetical protein NE237_012650 [Protea cynaroides]